MSEMGGNIQTLVFAVTAQKLAWVLSFSMDSIAREEQIAVNVGILHFFKVWDNMVSHSVYGV